MRYLLVALITSVFLTACETLPIIQHPVETQRDFDASKERVWAGLMVYFTTAGIQIKTIEKASGIIYAEQIAAGRDRSVDTLMHCGFYLEIPVESVIGFNVFVRSGPQLTTVSVNTSFFRTWLSYPSPNIGHPDRRFGNYQHQTKRSCTSTGALEQGILNYIGNYLAANPAPNGHYD